MELLSDEVYTKTLCLLGQGLLDFKLRAPVMAITPAFVCLFSRKE